MPKSKKVVKEEEAVEVSTPEIKIEEEVADVVVEVKEERKATGKFEADNGTLVDPSGRVIESGLTVLEAEKKAQRFNK